MAGERVDVDGRTGDDDLQVAAAVDETPQEAEQEVDVEAALVSFVDDHYVVRIEEPVTADLREQQPVSDQLHQRARARLIAEPHSEAHLVAEGHLHLLGDACRHRARRQPPRLGVGDHAAAAEPGLETDLRQLGGLTGAGLPGDDDDLMPLEQLADFRRVGGDGQRGGVIDHRRAGAALGERGTGALEQPTEPHPCSRAARVDGRRGA